MEIKQMDIDGLSVLKLSGRMDASGGKELQERLEQVITGGVIFVALDMSEVSYLSSAGLRIFILFHKKLAKLQGLLMLCCLQQYCRQVLDMAGFSSELPIFESIKDAQMFSEQKMKDKKIIDSWETLETHELRCGKVRIIPASSEPGTLEILGDVRNVLYSKISKESICSKYFSETEYSIGLGALGENPEDYFSIMGEMMTIGGTMVWLPTDGNDTPDFLIPKKDTGAVTIRTAFNVSISGGLNEFFRFSSTEPGGTEISTLYRDLFALAKKRRRDFKGVLAIAGRFEMQSVFSSGIKKAPAADSAPPDGKMITDKAHFDEWFIVDRESRHSDVTSLICGAGIDLTSDLSGYNKEQLNSMFYIHPDNVAQKTQMLHNHAVVFSKMPFADRQASLEKEISQVVETGDFIDMRHLLDNSRVTEGFFGISYIQYFTKDPRGFSHS